MKHESLTLLLALATTLACGGRVLEQPGSGGSAPDGSGAESPAPPASASDAGRSSSSPLPSHALGVCTPGFSRAEYPNRPCNWLTKDGFCFNEKEDACSCICPTSGGSLCFSDFDEGPGSATLVQCL